MTTRRLPTSSPPGRQLLLIAISVALLVEAADGIVTGLGQAAEFRLISILTSAGYLLVLGLAAYGVWTRARWGAWLIGVIACITVGFGIPTLLVGRMVINGVEVDQPLYSIILGWLRVAIYLLILIGLYRAKASAGRESG